MSPKITVYTTPVCYQCKMTKDQLDKHNTPYETVDITNPDNEAAYQAILNLGYTSAPVVTVQEKGKADVSWWGFRPDKLNGYTVKGAA